MELFEFGKYWDTLTFIVLLIIGLTVSFLCYKGALYNERKNRTGKLNIWYLIAFAILVFFNTLKSIKVGADTIVYAEWFEEIGSGGSLDLSDREPLFLFTTYLIYQIYPNFTFYLFIYSLIICFGFIYFIKHNWSSKSSYIFLFAFIVEYFYAMNVMRTGVGMAFILISLCFLMEKKYVRAIIFTIIGTCFHYTAIINLPLIIVLLLLRNKKIDFKRIITIAAVGVIAIVALLPVVTNYLSGTRFHLYVESSGANILGYWYVIFSILCAFFWIYKKRVIDNESRVVVMTSLYHIPILIFSMVLGAYRLINLYTIIRLLLWDKTVDKTNPRNKALIQFASVVIVGVYILFRISRMSSSEGFRYTFIGFEEDGICW